MLKKIFLFSFTMLLLNYESLFSKDLYPKNYNIDIINYSFEINLNDDDDIIYAWADVHVTASGSSGAS